MAINTEKWKNRWSSNEIIILVLASLGMQILLIFLAPLRKRSTKIFLTLLLWLLYLTADYVATLALGNISNQSGPAENGDSEARQGDLTVLWAPFLLLHLGGPDSITSYSIEDNELWWRHLLGLVVQVVITVYVFWQSPPHRLLWIPTIFVFIPGLIKFAERTHALRLGSKDNLKDKILSELSPASNKEEELPESIRNSKRESNDDSLDKSVSEHVVVPATATAAQTTTTTTTPPPPPPPSPSPLPPPTTEAATAATTTTRPLVPTNETKDKSKIESQRDSEKESQIINEGYFWFNKFKRLLVDVTFPSNLLMLSQDRFSEINAREALNLVAIELSFLYDILHTKSVHMHCFLGRLLRCTSLVSLIAALIVFHLIDMEKYAPKDIIITYVLFGTGLFLEVIATMLLVFSDWTVVSLNKMEQCKCFASAITALVKGITLKKGKTRWARTIGLYNLVGVCLRDRDTVLAKIMRFLKIKNKWDNMREGRLIPVPNKLEEIMFKEAKRRAQNVHIYKVLVEARSYRGSKTFERHGVKDLEWSMKREFDECIILWHLATDICYYNETSDEPKGNNDTEREVSWKTSNYMVYLLTQQQSMMQLGFGKTRFEATCAVVKKKFKGEGKLNHKKAHDVLLERNKAYNVLKKNEEAAKNEGATQVPEQNDASVSADSSQTTNKAGTSVLKTIWDILRCSGRRKGEEEKRKDQNEMGKLLLQQSHRLADELQKIKPDLKKWEVISETWMEMLGYAAIHCDSYQHAKSLSRGGELLTHLWLLMSQLGVVEEHKMQQFQSGSV